MPNKTTATVFGLVASSSTPHSHRHIWCSMLCLLSLSVVHILRAQTIDFYSESHTSQSPHGVHNKGTSQWTVLKSRHSKSWQKNQQQRTATAAVTRMPNEKVSNEANSWKWICFCFIFLWLISVPKKCEN